MREPRHNFQFLCGLIVCAAIAIGFYQILQRLAWLMAHYAP